MVEEFVEGSSVMVLNTLDRSNPREVYLQVGLAHVTREENKRGEVVVRMHPDFLKAEFRGKKVDQLVHKKHLKLIPEGVTVQAEQHG